MAELMSERERQAVHQTLVYLNQAWGQARQHAREQPHKHWCRVETLLRDAGILLDKMAEDAASEPVGIQDRGMQAKEKS